MSGNFFKFEREGVDFPFYRNNPKLTKLEWILLLISVLISSLYLFYLHLIFTSPCLSWICFLLPIFIILGICRFNSALIFKKLTKKDIPLIFKSTVLSIFMNLGLGIIFFFMVNVPPAPVSYLNTLLMVY